MEERTNEKGFFATPQIIINYWLLDLQNSANYGLLKHKQRTRDNMTLPSGTHNSERNLFRKKMKLMPPKLMPQTPKSIQLSDPIINVDWATQNKAISAERVAEQTLSTLKMFANFSPFRIPGVTGSEL